MAVQTVTSVSGEGGNSLRLYPDTLLYQLTAIANDLSAGVALLNQLRTHVLNGALGNPGFQIRSNFDVQNANAISYTNAGTLKTLAATQAFDTGTEAVIVADKWSSALLSLAANGTGTVTWSATLNAASEAAAIAALPAVPAGHTPLGYITVKTASGQTWTAGTDALKSGTGGNAASETNYYNSINPNTAQVGSAAPTADSIAFDTGVTP